MRVYIYKYVKYIYTLSQLLLLSIWQLDLINVDLVQYFFSFYLDQVLQNSIRSSLQEIRPVPKSTQTQNIRKLVRRKIQIQKEEKYSISQENSLKKYAPFKAVESKSNRVFGFLNRGLVPLDIGRGTTRIDDVGNPKLRRPHVAENRYHSFL